MTMSTKIMSLADDGRVTSGSTTIEMGLDRDDIEYEVIDHGEGEIEVRFWKEGHGHEQT